MTWSCHRHPSQPRNFSPFVVSEPTEANGLKCCAWLSAKPLSWFSSEEEKLGRAWNRVTDALVFLTCIPSSSRAQWHQCLGANKSSELLPVFLFLWPWISAPSRPPKKGPFPPLGLVLVFMHDVCHPFGHCCSCSPHIVDLERGVWRVAQPSRWKHLGTMPRDEEFIHSGMWGWFCPSFCGGGVYVFWPTYNHGRCCFSVGPPVSMVENGNWPEQRSWAPYLLSYTSWLDVWYHHVNVWHHCPMLEDTVTVLTAIDTAWLWLLCPVKQIFDQEISDWPCLAKWNHHGPEELATVPVSGWIIRKLRRCWSCFKNQPAVDLAKGVLKMAFLFW